MSQGVYGTKIPSIINPSTDVDIYYSYRESLGDDSFTKHNFIKLDSENLTQITMNNDSNNNTGYDSIIDGLYNMRLPLDKFNKKGFYSVYIKPKDIAVEIKDVGFLVSNTNIKGIVIDLDSIDVKYKHLFSTDNGLVGYRITYFDESQRKNYCRIITSNHKCEPVTQNLNNANQKSIKYKYTDNSNYVFITITPSLIPSYEINSDIYIGKSTQKIYVTNTLFEPILLDIEMVDHDFDTISTMLEGSQLRDLDNGLITTFDKNGQIYHQSEHYSLKNSMGKPVYEVKKEKDASIDFTQTINDK